MLTEPRDGWRDAQDKTEDKDPNCVLGENLWPRCARSNTDEEQCPFEFPELTPGKRSWFKYVHV